MTATDVDPAMLDTARQHLASFGDRVNVRQADATALPFAAGSSDAVVSFIMLHHTLRWEEALGGLAVRFHARRSGDTPQPHSAA